MSRVEDRGVISGIIFVIRNNLRWRDVPASYSPRETIYNRFIRWGEMGVFRRIFVEVSKGGGDTEEITIDATHLKAHRTAASLLKKGLFPDMSGAQSSLNSKLHAVCDSEGRPRSLFLAAGQRLHWRCCPAVDASTSQDRSG
jgi:putative transposase